MLLLCSNNYLGLADHPRVRRAAAEAAERYGAGAGASRLISGSMALHGKLEGRLAEFEGTSPRRCSSAPGTWRTPARSPRSPARATSSSPTSSTTRASSTAADSRGRATFVYRHGDLEHLEAGLREAGGRARLIVTDGVFSMDGDVAPLPGLVELARRHGCLLDGRRGPRHRCARPRAAAGRSAAAGLDDEVDVVIGTLGKALGSYGAYVCASTQLIELLRQRRPPVHLLDRAAAALGRRRARRARAARRGPRPGRAAAPQRRDPARGAARARARDRPLANPDRPGGGRRPAPGDGPLRARPRGAACSRRRSARRPSPRAAPACA